MSTPAQKKFFASLAACLAAGAEALTEMSRDTVVGEKPAKVATPKAAPPAEPPKAPTAGDIMAQCRSAAKAYAEVYGREGLKEVLKKFTEGTLADVPADKLPELLAALS